LVGVDLSTYSVLSFYGNIFEGRGLKAFSWDSVGDILLKGRPLEKYLGLG
jgi:hypothetical protein